MSTRAWGKLDEGTEWLQNNDENYKLKCKDKELEYPYLTIGREKRIRQREIYMELDKVDYFSCVRNNQIMYMGKNKKHKE